MTNKQRSQNIKAIKSQDTKIEVILHKALWAQGIRYRKNFKVCSCKPDIVLVKQNLLFFVMVTFGTVKLQKIYDKN